MKYNTRWKRNSTGHNLPVCTKHLTDARKEGKLGLWHPASVSSNDEFWFFSLFMIKAIHSFTLNFRISYQHLLWLLFIGNKSNWKLVMESPKVMYKENLWAGKINMLREMLIELDGMWIKRSAEHHRIEVIWHSKEGSVDVEFYDKTTVEPFRFFKFADCFQPHLLLIYSTHISHNHFL